MSRPATPADPDLAAMRSIARYQGVVDLVLTPVLAVRRLEMPACRHGAVSQVSDLRSDTVDDIDVVDPDDTPACDCAPLDRRAELWAIGDLCLKHGLTRTQLGHVAQIVLLKSRESVDLRVVRGAMFDLFAGVYAGRLKRVSKDDDGGGAPEEAPPRIADEIAA